MIYDVPTAELLQISVSPYVILYPQPSDPCTHFGLSAKHLTLQHGGLSI